MSQTCQKRPQIFAALVAVATQNLTFALASDCSYRLDLNQEVRAIEPRYFD
jgi:hypothetical protein